MDQTIADELIVMMKEDQQMLQWLFDSGELPSTSYHPRMKALHERNASRLKEIISSYGWPGITLVGDEAAKAAWLVAQHSVSDPEFMAECVGLLEGAVARKEVAGWQLAFLQDQCECYQASFNTMAHSSMLMKMAGQRRSRLKTLPPLTSAARFLG